MIRIDLQKKLNHINKTEVNFLNTYADDMIRREFKKTLSTTDKITGKKKYIDIYNLKLNYTDMYKHGDEKITMLVLFKHHYIHNIHFKYMVNDLKTFLKITTASNWEEEFLKKIITMDTTTLTETVKILDKHDLDKKTLKIITLMFHYENSRSNIVKFVRQLDFRVCIYCNRNHINNFVQKNGHYKNGKSNLKDRTLFTLDHYYQHADYPLLALSFLNLIPSCHVCNSMIKSSRNKINQFKNPYDKNYDFQELATFKLMKAKKVELSSDDEKCQKYIDDFYINEVYETHSVDVSEQLNKRDVFTDKLISKYAKLSNTTKQQVRDAVFGQGIHIDNFDKKPLSKLIYDIQKQIKVKS